MIFQKSSYRFVSIGMAIVGLILLLAPVDWFPSFYAVRFMGIGALVFAAGVQLPPVIFHGRRGLQAKAVFNLQKAVTIGLLLSGAGELGLWQLYRIGFPYDKLVHFIVPAMLAASLAGMGLHYWRMRFSRALFLAAGIVILLGVGWEAVEFYSDKLFGTQLFGVYGTDISIDTIVDLICNVLGVSTSLAIVAVKEK